MDVFWLAFAFGCGGFAVFFTHCKRKVDELELWEQAFNRKQNELTEINTRLHEAAYMLERPEVSKERVRRYLLGPRKP